MSRGHRKTGQENRAELIIQTAKRLFSHYGYEKTTIDDIAKEAGIGKGSVYLDFPTKEDILMQVIASFQEEQYDNMQRQMTDMQAPFLPKLYTVLLSHLLDIRRRCAEQAYSPELLFTTSRRVRQERRAFLEKCYQLWGNGLHQAAQAGEIPMFPDDAYPALAKTISNGLAAFLPPYSALYKEMSPECFEADAGRVLKLLLLGLTVNPGALEGETL